VTSDAAAAGDDLAAGTVLHLTVHPSVVFKLGADLITDDVQALLELVKNSYDADSPDALVDVDTSVWTDPTTGAEVDPPAPEPKSGGGLARLPTREQFHELFFPQVTSGGASGGEGTVPPAPPVLGRISVTDRGTGMDAEAIKHGWLTVSASEKRHMKARGFKTARGRTPLGDKGLGRLGAQRLGDILEIDTQAAGEAVAHRLQVRWSSFNEAESLEDVDLRLETRPAPPDRQGTTLTIRGLRDPSRWLGTDRADLERELSAMLSPYGRHDFDVTLRVDGQLADLRRRHDEVRGAALLGYRIRYEQGVLTIDGRISTAYFRPRGGDELPLYQRFVEVDNGADFRKWLLAHDSKSASSMSMSAGDDHYFLHVRQQVALRDLLGVRITRPDDDLEAGPIDPGPFSGEIDSVPLRVGEYDVFNNAAEYRDFVSAINGVRVYRDGFGVRVDKDWIGLASRWSTGTSYYNLRPENVVGYIDLTSEHNAQLVETTNREGFQDTPAYQNFLLLIEAWRGFTEQCQGFVRRQWLEYRSVRQKELVGDGPATPESIHARAESRRKQVGRSLDDARRLADALDAAVSSLRDDPEPNLFGDPSDLDRPRQAARVAVEAAAALNSRLAELDADSASAIADLDVLTGQISATQEQTASAWEAVSLGITAEALSHEVHHIADRLLARSQHILRHLRATDSHDTVVLGYVEHVRASAAALNRQMSHLNPALRYLRERRTTLQVSDIAQAVADHFGEMWADQGLEVRVEKVRDFTVEMNEGKLTQVLDNLIINSGYWVREGMRRSGAREGSIVLRVEAPFLSVTDSGPGVAPSIEEMIFEPFVTAKGRGQGRGLGLFVVRQLLDAEGAEITLDPPESPGDHRRTFRITFAPEEAAQ